eukprot:scaffold216432_cov19-Tisochrysis_lutea.AAC.1
MQKRHSSSSDSSSSCRKASAAAAATAAVVWLMCKSWLQLKCGGLPAMLLSCVQQLLWGLAQAQA